uniref:Uncharacterized protein n=1 Tax=Avena sativa TaxID=4498 RepID=A0ACD5TKJ7_AVESA
MKVLCSACEAAEARVLCCADEAALCERCDRDVHAANRLAGKHQRLPLLSPGSAAPVAPPPKCDICQECHAYFFCLEDRALLCRGCDVAVHTANALVSAHRRFLLTGVQVSLDEQKDCSPDQPEPSPAPPAKSVQATLYEDGDFNWAAAAATPDAAAVSDSFPNWSAVNEQLGSPVQRPADPASRNPPQKRSPRAPVFTGQGGMMDWPLGEFFGGFNNFNGGGFGFGESETSKADSGKQGGSSGGSPYCMSSSEDRNDEELFGQVPEMQWSVPELPSPPTASGLHWQRRPGSYGDSDSSAFVPDCFPADQLATAKRRRKC